MKKDRTIQIILDSLKTQLKELNQEKRIKLGKYAQIKLESLKSESELSSGIL